MAQHLHDEQNDHETTGQGEGAAIPETVVEPVGGEHGNQAPIGGMATVHEIHPHQPASGPEVYAQPGSELAGDGGLCFPPEARVLFVRFYRSLVGSGQLSPLPGDELPSCLR